MNIGLDYDDTYTRDPLFWADFILRATAHGSRVYIVTWRNKQEAAEMEIPDLTRGLLAGIYATNRKAKEPFMYAQGIRIDVMIDDNPRSWVQTMEGH